MRCPAPTYIPDGYFSSAPVSLRATRQVRALTFPEVKPRFCTIWVCAACPPPRQPLRCFPLFIFMTNNIYTACKGLAGIHRWDVPCPVCKNVFPPSPHRGMGERLEIALFYFFFLPVASRIPRNHVKITPVGGRGGWGWC